MKDKLKAIFDSRATWTMIGSFAGAVLGEKALTVVNAVGSVVMAVL